MINDLVGLVVLGSFVAAVAVGVWFWFVRYAVEWDEKQKRRAAWREQHPDG